MRYDMKNGELVAVEFAPQYMRNNDAFRELFFE